MPEALEKNARTDATKRGHDEVDCTLVDRSNKRQCPRTAQRECRVRKVAPEPVSHKCQGNNSGRHRAAPKASKVPQRDSINSRTSDKPRGIIGASDHEIQHGATLSAAPRHCDSRKNRNMGDESEDTPGRNPGMYCPDPEDNDAAFQELRRRVVQLRSMPTYLDQALDRTGASSPSDRSVLEVDAQLANATRANAHLFGSYSQDGSHHDTQGQSLDLQANAFQDFDNNQNFNLDFSILDSSDVLGNFDFDSFLNTSTEDAFNFDGSMAVGDFTLDPVDAVRETKLVQSPAAPISVSASAFVSTYPAC